MCNSKNTCDECDKGSRSSVGLYNNDKKQDKNDGYETNINNKIQNNMKIKKRKVIKEKVKLDYVKGEIVVRLFSVNCNGFGPNSAGKIEQLKLMSKTKK